MVTIFIDMITWVKCLNFADILVYVEIPLHINASFAFLKLRFNIISEMIEQEY